MIFSDISALNSIINSSRENLVFKDNDAEIDRLLSCSPPLSVSNLFIPDDIDNNMKTTPRKILSNNMNSKENDTVAKSVPVDNSKNIFIPVKVPTKNELPNKKSALTLALEAPPQTIKPNVDTSSSIDRIKLTIYLPTHNAMSIMVSDSDTCAIIIKKILTQHEVTKLTPSLNYDQPQGYELRIHEGDGEPDYDFPALDLNKQIKYFNDKEFCLVQKKKQQLTPVSPVHRGTTSPVTDRNSGSSSSGGGITGYTSGRRSEKDDGTKLIISIPNVAYIRVPYNPNECFIDLLPYIANELEKKGHKLRLHTDEFVFVISSEDQTLHKLYTPYVTLNTVIGTLPCRRYELQKRIFADSVRTVRMSTQKKIVKNEGDKVQYTDTLANVYQEWNLLKKNKYGRKQERTMGIDGKHVYTSKRGEKRGVGAGNVAKAQREISSIKKIEILESDKKSFRIIWYENELKTDTNEVEYTCDNIKDCAEIYAKLSYLLSRLEDMI